MEIKPFLRVVLNELASLSLLRYYKVCAYLGKFPSLEVSEIASGKKFRILRHIVTVGLAAEYILLLQGVTLTESLHDIGKHVLKQGVLFGIGAELLHRIPHFKNDRRLTLGGEKDNIAVRFLQLRVYSVKYLFQRFSHVSAFENIVVDENSAVALLVVKPSALFDIDCHKSCHGQHKHGDEAGELAERDREYYEAYERHSYGTCGQSKETSTYAHELQRLLKPLENRIAVFVHRHVCLFLPVIS